MKIKITKAQLSFLVRTLQRKAAMVLDGDYGPSDRKWAGHLKLIADIVSDGDFSPLDTDGWVEIDCALSSAMSWERNAGRQGSAQHAAACALAELFGGDGSEAEAVGVEVVK